MLQDSSLSLAQSASPGAASAVRSLPPTSTEGNAAAPPAQASSHSALTGSSIEATGPVACNQAPQPEGGGSRQDWPHSWSAAVAGAAAMAASAPASAPATAGGSAPTTASGSAPAISKHLSLASKARPSPFAAMSAARSRVAPPMPLPPGQLGELPCSSREASSGLILPELKEHIANCDAAISYGRCGSSGKGLALLVDGWLCSALCESVQLAGKDHLRQASMMMRPARLLMPRACLGLFRRCCPVSFLTAPPRTGCVAGIWRQRAARTKRSSSSPPCWSAASCPLCCRCGRAARIAGSTGRSCAA